MYRYPHEFSGGQRQRICVAKSLVLNPKLIVLDEPVSALDVSIQAQLLNLMKDLQRDLGVAFIFIAHDLSVVQYMSDRIAVMYLGNVVELATADDLYEKRLHPYTQALLSAVPIPQFNAKKDRVILEGDVPSPMNPPTGCPFHPRCSKCMDICKESKPDLRDMGGDHCVACHLYDEQV
jgi:peptide/nickel transport system ATP-binding protein/oligopeptide transport system ATP-binding protein